MKHLFSFWNTFVGLIVVSLENKQEIEQVSEKRFSKVDLIADGKIISFSPK